MPQNRLSEEFSLSIEAIPTGTSTTKPERGLIYVTICGMGIRLDESAGPIKAGVESFQSAFINARPGIVERKARRGDWEGDTIGEPARQAMWLPSSIERPSTLLHAGSSIRPLNPLYEELRTHSGR